MNLEDLEEALSEVIPSNFHISRDKHGQLVIMTSLCEDDDGDLVDFQPEDEEDEDEDYDHDFESLDEDLDDDE